MCQVSHTYLAFAFRKEGRPGNPEGAPPRGRSKPAHAQCTERDIVMLRSADGGSGAAPPGGPGGLQPAAGEVAAPPAKRRRERSPGRDQGETRDAVVYGAGAADSLLD